MADPIQAEQADNIRRIRATLSAWFWLNLITGVIGFLVSAWGALGPAFKAGPQAPADPKKK